MTNQEKDNLQQEIREKLDYIPHGRLILAPRVGKTKITINIITNAALKSVLWVSPSVKLIENDIPEEFLKWDAMQYADKVTFCTYASLPKIEGYYDMIVLDEDQHLTERNVQPLFNGKLDYISVLGLTGTPTKSTIKLDLYEKLDMPILYELSINQAVNIGLLSNYKINVVLIPLSNEKNIKAGNKANRFMTSEIAQYLYLTKLYEKLRDSGSKSTKAAVIKRMHFLKKCKSKHDKAKEIFNALPGRRLMFCSSISQAENLSLHTYHSKSDDKALEAFQSGEISEICMVNSGGTGFTYKAIDHLLIVQADSDTNGLTTQKICRTLLDQTDYEATVWLLCLKGTQDEKWVKKTLENFDSTKINYLNEHGYKQGNL